MIADGKHIAQTIENDLRERLAQQPSKRVCFVMLGENPASLQFVGMKTRMAERLGISVSVEKLSEDIETDELCTIVKTISSVGYDGIVIQLPLPKHIDTQKVLDTVPVAQDIDVLSTAAKEALVQGNFTKIPPVARAVFEVLDFYKISLAGKDILIVGNGRLVGEPVATILNHRKLPFHIINKKTSDEEKLLRLKSADIIISGVGSPHFIRPDMIKHGVVLVDAGTSGQSGKLVGDIDPACTEIASLSTPVPGGIGLITVACLFANLLE